jgi:hypothetical protein
VDLSNYTAHLNAAAAAASAAEAAAERGVPPMTSVTPPLTVNRRPALDLSLPMPPPRESAPGERSVQEHSLDLDSPLDVPAFLRRQS